MDKILKGDLSLDNINDTQQKRMCELCQDYVFEQKMNTNQYNLCEGSKCDLAFEHLEEEVEREREDNAKLLEEAFNCIK